MNDEELEKKVKALSFWSGKNSMTIEDMAAIAKGDPRVTVNGKIIVDLDDPPGKHEIRVTRLPEDNTLVIETVEPGAGGTPLSTPKRRAQGCFEHALEALVNVGARKLPAGVARFGESGDGLARQPAVDEFDGEARVARAQKRFDVGDVRSGVRDAVAEKEHALRAVQPGEER